MVPCDFALVTLKHTIRKALGTLGVELADSSSKMLEFGTSITSVAQMRAELQRFKVRGQECEIARVNYSDSVNYSDCYVTWLSIDGAFIFSHNSTLIPPTEVSLRQ